MVGPKKLARRLLIDGEPNLRSIFMATYEHSGRDVAKMSFSETSLGSDFAMVEEKLALAMPKQAAAQPPADGAALQAQRSTPGQSPAASRVHGQGQLGEPGCDPELVARSSAASPRHIPRGARAVANLDTRGGGERGTGPYPHALRRGKPDRTPARDPPLTQFQVCSRTPPTPARRPVPSRLSLSAPT